jgi:hypothetical protein
MSAPAHAIDLEEIYDWAVRHGTARATLTGPALSKWTQLSKTQTPVMLEVKELERLEPAHCARLAVTGTQNDVADASGRRAPLTVRWELDYCMPPATRAAAGDGSRRARFESYDAGPPSAQRLKNISQLDAGSHRRKHYQDKSIEAEMRALGY